MCSLSEQRQSCRSTVFWVIGRTQIMSLCCFFLVEMVRCCGSSVHSVHGPSPFRRMLCHVSCVRLSRNVHPHPFELRRICIAFFVAECIVAHGPEMRFTCLFFFYKPEVVTLTSCCFLGFLSIAAVSHLRSKVPSSKLAPSRQSFGLAARKSRTSCRNPLTASTLSSVQSPERDGE